MEFHEKLQVLRKQKGLTQEELARELFVSRAAVSKWESGRGYPSIDSLRAIGAFFGISVDELLSGDALLTLAEEDGKEKANAVRDMVFGLLDCSALLALFLPLFGQAENGVVQAVSLLALTGIALYLRAAFFAAVIGMVAWGLLTLVLQNCRRGLWMRNKQWVSLGLNAGGMLLFVMSRQPYGAAFLFAILAIKAYLLLKKQ